MSRRSQSYNKRNFVNIKEVYVANITASLKSKLLSIFFNHSQHEGLVNFIF